jgi:hypothetical protein
MSFNDRRQKFGSKPDASPWNRSARPQFSTVDASQNGDDK